MSLQIKKLANLVLILICLSCTKEAHENQSEMMFRLEIGSPDTKFDIIDFILKVISSLGPVIALGSIWFQIRSRKRDDRLKNQLDRVNKQISDFYGPLYSLYETGHRNYYSFIKFFGTNVTFSNPNFKDWVYTVFQPTNLAIEHIIIHKADLVVGKNVPNCLLQFCKWSATMKVYTAAQLENNFNKNKWDLLLKNIPHPEIFMQAYLHATLEVLKEEQSRLLSGKMRRSNRGGSSSILSRNTRETFFKRIRALLSEAYKKPSNDERINLADAMDRQFSENRLQHPIEFSLLNDGLCNLFLLDADKMVSDAAKSRSLEDFFLRFLCQTAEMLAVELAEGNLQEDGSIQPQKREDGQRPKFTEVEARTFLDELSILMECEKNEVSKVKRNKFFGWVKDFLANDYVNEEVIMKDISRRTNVVIAISRSSLTWENEIHAELRKNPIVINPYYSEYFHTPSVKSVRVASSRIVTDKG